MDVGILRGTWIDEAQRILNPQPRKWRKASSPFLGTTLYRVTDDNIGAMLSAQFLP